MPEQKLTYITLHGIPLTFKLQFPYHPSSSGADYFVLHGNAALEDGSGLYAELAVHMSQVVKAALPAVDEKTALAPTINAVRKATDTKDIEFLKSNKRQPIPLSSRAFSVVTGKFTFQNPDDEQLLEFIKSKAYWLTKCGGTSAWITDPVDTLYLGATSARLLGAAKKLAALGLLQVNGDYATATDALMKQGAEIESRTKKALEDLNAKHAYERG